MVEATRKIRDRTAGLVSEREASLCSDRADASHAEPKLVPDPGDIGIALRRRGEAQLVVIAAREQARQCKLTLRNGQQSFD